MAARPVIARVLFAFKVAGTAPRWLALLMLCALASCGGQRLSSGGSYPHYAAPGSASDPWGPFIREASGRYGVPERWIREVMRQESGGHQYLRGQPITSDAGAAGLMQLMPATYAELRGRYGLGDDPYDPHDNIMAGTAYIGELYKAYGSPAFLAAYNAGPHRLEAYMAGGSSLPNQTVDYLASIAPRLGNDRPMSGPLAAYADGGQAIEVAQAEPVQPAPEPAPIYRSPSAYVPHDFVRPPRPGCWQDPNAAYDPDAPCQAPPPVSPPAPQPQRLAEAEPAQAPEGGGTVPGATLWGSGAAAPPPQRTAQQAYSPPPYTPPAYAPPASTPPAQAPLPRYAEMSPPPAPLRSPEPQAPSHRFAFMPSAAAATVRPAMASGGWAVQVGAFANPAQARSVAETARTRAPRELQSAQTVLGTTAPFGGQVLYRARLLGLSAGTASAACGELAAQSMACVTVPPGG